MAENQCAPTPDFNLPAYQPWRDMIANNNIELTNDQIVQQLTATWRTTNPPPPQQQQQQPIQNQYHDEPQDKTDSALAKRMVEIPDGTQVDDHSLIHIGQYPLRQMKRIAFCELYYWTPSAQDEALADSMDPASTGALSLEHDAHGAIQFKPTARPSSKAKDDRDLDWGDFTIATDQFMVYTEIAQWPPKHSEQTGKFFFAMQHHRILQKPHGRRTILRYVSLQRKKWYARLETNLKFDISIINNFDIESIHRDILEEERSKAHLELVSPPPPPPHLTSPLSSLNPLSKLTAPLYAISPPPTLLSILLF